MEKIKIGVVGITRGLPYAMAYATEFDETCLVAVCENDPERAEFAKQYLPEETLFFDDFEEFLQSDLDAIVLCNYFHEHAKYAIAAMKKGIHILSETTAAPTLGECVALCAAAEESGAKYMLATNVPHMYGCMDMNRLYQNGSGTFGRVLYAEGEYFHSSDPTATKSTQVSDACVQAKYHWRKFLPRTYYNMHDLGTLMLVTKTLPKKVNAKAIFAPDIMKNNWRSNVGDVGAVVLTEMDNGAIFRTTGCASLGPNGKWFRLTCENGTIETVRGDQDSIMYTYNKWAVPDNQEQKKTYDARPLESDVKTAASGHGGSDYRICKAFVDCLTEKEEPFFDVYRSVALSAAGILAWRSVLEDGRGFDIPDFKNKEQRAAYANDFLSPFPSIHDGSGITLPCSSKPYERNYRDTEERKQEITAINYDA